tara:strand:+ start:2028 stop:2624 length:597 start_codon:yes stop_codon:yes gene_type:complete
MTFKLKSGNTTNFKSMGSSPALNMKDGSYKQSFESPAKQKLNKGGEGQDQDKIFNSKGEHIGDYVNDKPVMKPGFKRPVVQPTDKDKTTGKAKLPTAKKAKPNPQPRKHREIGISLKKSPAKAMGPGGITVDRDRDQKLWDGLLSAQTIDKRHRKNTLERAEGERLSEAADAGIAKEEATQRRHQSAHRDPQTGDWKA